MADEYIGQQIGNYRLLRPIGQGSFAEIYLAEHLYLEVLAAIKILHMHMGPAKHESFLNEARTIARLQHPHIVRILDFGFREQMPYLVMEYAPNGTLRSLYPRGTRVPSEQIISYVGQIASALDYAHGQQMRIVHRDIKPENILLNARHELLLSDFGIAVVERTRGSLSTQQMAGTPLYMAPEQIDGHPCPASDQYALGIMVYEWLCGEPPFHGGTALEICYQQKLRDPPSLCARLPQLPPAVEDAVLGALAKNPEHRFSSVQDFAMMLEEAFYATQLLPSGGSVEYETKNEITRSLVPVRLVPTPVPKEADASDDATQPRLKAIRRSEEQQAPVSIMCVCAPEDRALLEQWEAHLHLLEQAGILKVWSERRLLAGASRLQQINQHLDQADLIVLLLSADFFSSDECIALMQRALQRQREGVFVVPLLLRPVEWDASPLASLSYIPSNGRPITSWVDRDAAFELCVRDIRRLLGHTMPLEQRLPLAIVSSSIAERNRQTLLRKVRSVWIEGVLNHSLHHAALLSLELEKLPDAVANPWRLVFQQPETTPRPLPAGTRVTQVYDEALGDLLILGAPGAGKTTLLLELARDLLERAERDKRHPMPVVFNLSSWAIKEQSLEAWLADELNSRYQVPLKMARALVEAEQILPLLDGLDEVVPRGRSACIEAINTYKQEHGFLPLVVCSRCADYLAQTMRVHLSCAVVVQPLNTQQVNNYLARVGEGLRGLRVALQQDQALRELTHSPLLLSLLTLTYAHRSAQDVLRQPSSTPYIHQVVEHYVERMLTRGNEGTGYTPQATRHWLSWLARQLQYHNQTVFHIEHIQPDWVERQSTSKYYPRMVIGLLFALLAIVASVPIWGGIALQLPPSSPFQHINPLVRMGLALLFMLIEGLCFGFVNALLYKQRREKVAVTQTQLRWRQIRGGISRSIMNGLLSGLFIGCLPGAIAGYISPIGLLVSSLFVGSTGALVFGLVEGLLHIQPTSIQPADTVTWSWINMGRNLIKFFLLGLLGALLVGLLMAIIDLLFNPFTPDQIISALRFGLIVARDYAPLFALVGTVLGSLIGGLSSTVLDRRNTARPNQGIRRSAFLSLRTSLVGIFSTAMLVGILSLLAMQINNGGLLYFALIIVIIGPLFTLVSTLRVGGMACIQHGVLRWLLWRDRAMPWNYARFLDHAARRILLQKVGGGYMFVHRFVLEYFAKLERT